MKLIPPEPPFLEAQVKIEAPAVLAAFPLDFTTSFRKGTALAPQKIREASDSLESYSPRLAKNLSGLDFADWGTLWLPESLEESLQEITSCAQKAFQQSKFSLFLGGEHSITIAIARALKEIKPSVNFIFLDAHLDARQSYLEEKNSHASVVSRVAEMFPHSEIMILGVRSGSQEDFEFVQKKGIYYSENLSLPERTLTLLKRKPLYLSLDIDVLDPSVAPGTGNPEPPGVNFSELLEFLYSLQGANLVGMDLVEVSPPWDESDRTVIAAAKIIREAILLFD